MICRIYKKVTEQCNQMDSVVRAIFTTTGYDDVRYHIFTYRNEEPIENMFSWKKDQGETIYDGNYIDATNKWLDEINVLAMSRPQHINCVYWYKSHEDRSEIIML